MCKSSSFGFGFVIGVKQSQSIYGELYTNVF